MSDTLLRNAIVRRETNERWANRPPASTPSLSGRGVPRWRSLAALHPELAAQLHLTRNGELDPYQIALTSTSRRSVWWCCGSCGHELRTLLSTRVRGYGCPECRRLASIGRRSRVARERSLGALRPDLAAELHPRRDGDLDAFAVARWSVQPVWWRWRSCGHEWRVTPQSRAGRPAHGARRPVARERSLAVLRPDGAPASSGVLCEGLAVGRTRRRRAGRAALKRPSSAR